MLASLLRLGFSFKHRYVFSWGLEFVYHDKYVVPGRGLQINLENSLVGAVIRLLFLGCDFDAGVCCNVSCRVHQFANELLVLACDDFRESEFELTYEIVNFKVVEVVWVVSIVNLQEEFLLSFEVVVNVNIFDPFRV